MVSLSDYLVYTSIKEKFNIAYRKIHFYQVIHDTFKILPNIIRTFLYNIYSKVDFEDKNKIIEILNLNEIFVKEESEVKTLLLFVAQINLKLVVNKGGNEFVNTINILQTLSSSEKKILALRYISVIEYLLFYFKNENFSAILEFAEKVKKTYLEKRNIVEKADIINIYSMSENKHLSGFSTENIINKVINIVEDENFVFQKFYDKKRHVYNIYIEKEITNLFKFACIKLNDNKIRQAIIDLTKIIELRNDVAFYYIYRGIAFEVLRNYEKSEQDFKEVLKINPQCEFYFYNKGLARFEINDY